MLAVASVSFSRFAHVERTDYAATRTQTIHGPRWADPRLMRLAELAGYGYGSTLVAAAFVLMATALNGEAACHKVGAGALGVATWRGRARRS